jgi:WD40 repeat protein
MGNKRWLLLGTGLLLLSPSSNPRAQGAEPPERLLRTFDGHSEAVNNVVFSPDGKRLVSASDDATVRM